MLPIHQLAPVLCAQHGFIAAMYALVLQAATQARGSMKMRRLQGLYHSDDLTVIGGAAYSLYSYQFGLPPMETRDIDMVWWASRLVSNDDLLRLSQTFAQSLYEMANRTEIRESLRKVIARFRQQEDVPEVYVEVSTPIIRMDNHNIVKQISIKLTLLMGREQLTNLCDITLHNGLNSQVEGLDAAESDPTYCDQRPHYTGIMGITRVPLLHRFLNQQLFAHMVLSYAYSDLPSSERQPRANKCLRRVLHLGRSAMEHTRHVVDNSLRMYLYGVLASSCHQESFVEMLESAVKGEHFPQTQQAIRMYRS